MAQPNAPQQPTIDPFLNPNATLGDIHPVLGEITPVQNVQDQNSMISGGANGNLANPPAGMQLQPPSPPVQQAPVQNQPLDASKYGIIGAGIGAGAGYAMPLPKAVAPPDVISANTSAAGQSASAQAMMADLVKRQLAHTNQLSSLQQAMQTTGQMHDQHVGNLANATQAAKQLNAMPLTPTPGDNWAFGSEAKGTVGGVTGSMGPGGNSVTESSRNYRMQQGNKEFEGLGLKGSEGAKFRVNRAGIIEPNRDTPFTPSQEAAQKAYLDAQQKVAESEAKLKELRAEHDKLAKAGPYSRQHDEAVSRQQALAEGEKVKAEEMAKQSKAEGNMARLGRMLGRFAPPSGGSIAGYFGAQAKNEFDQGRYGPMAIHALGALGGTGMMAPHAAVRGAGALATIPGIAYDVYNGNQPSEWDDNSPLPKTR